MLTNNDLAKIGDLIENKLEEKLERKLKPVKQKLNKIKKTLDVAIDNSLMNLLNMKNDLEKLKFTLISHQAIEVKILP